MIVELSGWNDRDGMNKPPQEQGGYVVVISYLACLLHHVLHR